MKKITPAYGGNWPDQLQKNGSPASGRLATNLKSLSSGGGKRTRPHPDKKNDHPLEEDPAPGHLLVQSTTALTVNAGFLDSSKACCLAAKIFVIRLGGQYAVPGEYFAQNFAFCAHLLEFPPALCRICLWDLFRNLSPGLCLQTSGCCERKQVHFLGKSKTLGS